LRETFVFAGIMAVSYNDNGLAAGSGDYLSVRPSVYHTPLLYQNGSTYYHANNAIR